jgi:hypothetical protein
MIDFSKNLAHEGYEQCEIPEKGQIFELE